MLPKINVRLHACGIATLAICLAMLAAVPGPAAALTLPPGFQQSTAITGLNDPMDADIAPNGRVFVAEQGGTIQTFDNLADPTPTMFADLRTQVHNFSSRGLLGLAIDPGFPAKPYVYVYYTLDAPIGGTPPTFGNPGQTSDQCPGDTDEVNCIVSQRVSRLRVSGEVQDGPEQVLVNDWCQQFQYHPGGGIDFGADGYLYVAGGDGARWEIFDYGQLGNPMNPCGDPPSPVGGPMSPPTAEGGRLRAQDLRTSGDPLGLNGSLIRIDPDTGEGAPGNPMAASADPNARRMLAHGFRNPVRLAIRPGTNDVWVADRGGGYWEEFDRIPEPTDPVRNFGWPCYEGGLDANGVPYARIRPRSNDQDLDICEDLYAAGNLTSAPYWGYDHEEPVVPGEDCEQDPNTGEPIGNQIGGVSFYPAAGSFPAVYRNALFFADRLRNCMWVMLPGTDGLPDRSRVLPFGQQLPRAMDIEIAPGGDLLYVDQAAEAIQRIEWAGTSSSAIDTPAAGTTWATGETISFSGSGTDSDGGALPASALDWSVVLVRCPAPENCQETVVTSLDGAAGGSFTAPDADYPAHLDIRLTVTDSGGETETFTRRLDPRTANMTLASTPSGAGVTIDGIEGSAPFTRPAIIGSTVSVSATAQQAIGNTTQRFSSWSDGQAQTHNITMPATSTALTARFAPVTPGSSTLGFLAAADAKVEQANPTTNFGALDSLRTDVGTNDDAYSYLRFVVGGISGKVTSAKLRLRSNTETVDGPELRGTSNDWQESGITWQNKPAATTGVVSDVGPIGPGEWVEWDVTSLVTANGTYNFRLSNTSTDGLTFRSREYSNASLRPELVVEVTNDAYPRPSAASPLRMSLVPAYAGCTGPNRVHGPPLEHPSCAPPGLRSSALTFGTPDANGLQANSGGFALFRVTAGNPATTEDEADVAVVMHLTDVREAAGLHLDYTGDLQLRAMLRLTDRQSAAAGTATVQDIPVPVTVPCTPTLSLFAGSDCDVATTLDALTPGTVDEGARAVWQLADMEVLDGGPDGDVNTPGNSALARPGVFVP